MYKIVYGIPCGIVPMDKELLNDKGSIEDYLVEDDCDMMCDFELIYYPESEIYKFDFETLLGFEKPDGARSWIVRCFSELTDYMKKNNYDVNREVDLYDAFTSGWNVDTDFTTIEDAYSWLKMMVFGFHGDGVA